MFWQCGWAVQRRHHSGSSPKPTATSLLAVFFLLRLLTHLPPRAIGILPLRQSIPVSARSQIRRTRTLTSCRHSSPSPGGRASERRRCGGYSRSSRWRCRWRRRATRRRSAPGRRGRCGGCLSATGCVTAWR
jgi:hypothetical protein